MKTNTFRGRDYITLLNYSREEIDTLLDVALDLKRKFVTGEPHHLLSESGCTSTSLSGSWVSNTGHF